MRSSWLPRGETEDGCEGQEQFNRSKQCSDSIDPEIRAEDSQLEERNKRTRSWVATVPRSKCSDWETKWAASVRLVRSPETSCDNGENEQPFEELPPRIWCLWGQSQQNDRGGQELHPLTRFKCDML